MRSLQARVTVSLAVAAALLASSIPAGAVATDDSTVVPADGALMVKGRGFGHGHGMSQYGAEGAAREGLGYRRILAFYYPGTTLGSTRGTIRVLITAATTRDLEVSPAPGLVLRDLGDGTSYQLPDNGATRWRLRTTGSGGGAVAEKVQYLTDRWHRYRPSGKDVLAGDGQLAADGPLRLRLSSGSRAYRGALRLATPSPGSGDRDTVNVVRLEDYVKGVVAAEMPASWHAQAVRSQAVAARTYAAWDRAQGRRAYYHVCDTTACQVYGGVAAEDPRSNAAVDATAQRILRFDGEPAFAQFSSSSGGWTSAGAAPYLTAHRDPYDGWSGNPVHGWTVTTTAAVLERAYPALGRLQRIRVVDRDGNGRWGGRVQRAVLDGTAADVTTSGDDLRRALGLRSSWFRVLPGS